MNVYECAKSQRAPSITCLCATAWLIGVQVHIFLFWVTMKIKICPLFFGFEVFLHYLHRRFPDEKKFPIL